MENYIDLVVVRHGNTSSEDEAALKAGNAHLSKEDFWQVEEARDQLSGISFDYVGVGAIRRMMETLDEVRKGIKTKYEECDTRLDSRTNSWGSELYPENHDDVFYGEDGYHQRAQKILRVLASNKLPSGGRALLITTGAIIVPLYVIANGVNPTSEAHYNNKDVYGRFSPKPGSIHCFRYCLETGELRTITLDEVKSSS